MSKDFKTNTTINLTISEVRDMVTDLQYRCFHMGVPPEGIRIGADEEVYFNIHRDKSPTYEERDYEQVEQALEQMFNALRIVNTHNLLNYGRAISRQQIFMPK